MGIVEYVKDIWEISTAVPEQPQQDNGPDYPVYAKDFVYNIVWQCLDCQTEFVKNADERGYICPECIRHYKCRRSEDTPVPVRARCPRCDNVSSDLYASRHENMGFDCEHCPYRWESSRY